MEENQYTKHLAKNQLCAKFHLQIYSEKCFTQIYIALYGHAMLVPL